MRELEERIKLVVPESLKVEDNSLRVDYQNIWSLGNERSL